MKRANRTGLAAMVAVLLSASAGAEDGTRFESNGFLESLDLFMSEHMAWLRPSPRDTGVEGLKELELSLREPAGGKEQGFFYLRDRSLPSPADRAPGNIPDFSSLVAPEGSHGPNRVAMAGGDSSLSLRFGRPDNDKAVTLGLTSSYRIEGDRRATVSDAFGLGVGLGAHQIESGLSLGFGGFAVDASVLQVTDHATGTATGYDVGLSWTSGSFATRLSLSEYREGADLLGIDNDARDVMAVELGASYRLSERLGVSGGVRYLDYSSRLLATPFSADNAQMVFLGGQFRF